MLTDVVAPQGEMEAVKEEIIKLCQRKEDFLTGMKNSMSELHQRLQQEVPEAADEPPASVLAQSDLIGTDVPGQQVSDHSPEGQRGEVKNPSCSWRSGMWERSTPAPVNQYFLSSPLCSEGLSVRHV